MTVVLVIDDDAQIRNLWTDALTEEGFDVRAASSGAQGVKIAENEDIDVIVTDILMPEKDGIEAMREIKTVRPQARVLAVSGGGELLDKSFLEFAKRLGADATLQKPVDIDHLCRIVAELAAPA